ncbi:MAG: ATP-binding protein [Kofleriaceae bacterium]
MSVAPSLVELGDRYWALGLPAAAKSVLTRALAITNDGAPALRLTAIALAQGDAGAARTYAQEAAKRSPDPATRIVLGGAQLAAGEIVAARMALLAALDAPGLGDWDRARAHLGLARAADLQGDVAGAAANASAAFAEVVAAARDGVANAALILVEEIAAAVVAYGRTADAAEVIATGGDHPGRRICSAVLLVARHAAGDTSVDERAIDAELAAIADPTSALELRRLERRARRASAADRDVLIRELEPLIDTAMAEQLPAADRARLWFLYGSLCAERNAGDDLAEAAYRKGLAFQPGHTGAACRLALLMLERGDRAGALAEIERALRVDATHGMAWRNAARMIDPGSPSLGVVVSRLLDAADPGAGTAAESVAPRLLTATAEVTRHDVLDGVYAHGHRVKNLLGIIGARARSARKLAAPGELADRLRDLERDVTSLYEEWAHYLRSMHAPTPTIELVPFAALVHDVVEAARERNQQVAITIDASTAVPDVRGDRGLLREAMLNVMFNAVEACATNAGAVTVRARGVAAPSGGAPVVELVVADSGPGIPRAHLGRLFVPGFTTKDTGSGFGLAIAERAVAAHHGRITIDSEPGRGTTLTITLPTDARGLTALPAWLAAERGLR